MNTPPVLRILQASDFHLCADPDTLTYGINTERSLGKVLNALREYALSDGLLVATGDLSQDGSAASYDRLRLIFQRIRMEFCCLPGNHDDVRRMRASLPCPQRIRRAGWHIILLDTTLPESQGGRVNESDLVHIEKWLREEPYTPCLIFMHHAAISLSSPWLDTMRIDNADILLDCLTAFDQIKAIVFGHVHQEVDIHYRGIRFLACPSTCAQFLPESTHFALDPVAPGFRWIDLYENGHMETGIVRV